MLFAWVGSIVISNCCSANTNNILDSLYILDGPHITRSRTKWNRRDNDKKKKVLVLVVLWPGSVFACCCSWWWWWWSPERWSGGGGGRVDRVVLASRMRTTAGCTTCILNLFFADCDFPMFNVMSWAQSQSLVECVLCTTIMMAILGYYTIQRFYTNKYDLITHIINIQLVLYSLNGSIQNY